MVCVLPITNALREIHFFVLQRSSRITNNESVQVVVRCRPMSEKEIDGGYSNTVNIYSSRGVIEVINPKAKSENERNKLFTYDAVYGWK